MENEEEGDIALHILALAIDDSTLLPDETRAVIVEELPGIVRRIASFWRNPPAPPSCKSPSRSLKIGRTNHAHAGG